MRLLSAALHRSGTVRMLQALWRADVKHARERSDERAEKLIQRSESTLRQDVNRQDKALGDAFEAIKADVTRLSAQCEELGRRARSLEETLARNRDQVEVLRRFRTSCADGSIAEHVARAIAAAPLREDPAPLVTIDRLLSRQVYETFVAAIPTREAFEVKDRSKLNYRVERPQALVSDLSDAVWTFFDRELVPQAMVPALAARFRPYIASYYEQLLGPVAGPAVAALPLEATVGRLMLRLPGYHLEPHLDPKRVLVTFLLYLARRGDRDSYGTSFYRIDGRVVRDHSSTYYPAQAGHTCDHVFTVPFRANTAVAFLNSAAHGAEIPPSAPEGTERYTFQYYIGPPVDALRDIIRTLSPSDQAPWAGLLGTGE